MNFLFHNFHCIVGVVTEKSCSESRMNFLYEFSKLLCSSCSTVEKILNIFDNKCGIVVRRMLGSITALSDPFRLLSDRFQLVFDCPQMNLNHYCVHHP